jgi:integrative and conjugative element protein (TIGR02256 family)
MQYLAGWASLDGTSLILFSSQSLEQMAGWRQSGALPEAGGLLLGFRRGDHFEVLTATTPFPTDLRTRHGFIRNPNGHQQEATRLWQESKGTVDYLGEWHTHPEALPTPSSLDLKEWRKLVAKRVPPSPMLAVIVGTQQLHVLLVQPGGSLVNYIGVG